MGPKFHIIFPKFYKLKFSPENILTENFTVLVQDIFDILTIFKFQPAQNSDHS